MRWYHIATVMCLLAPAVSAQSLPDGGVTGEEVAKVMTEKGLKTEVTTDKDGDPLIRTFSKDTKYGVFFYGCNAKSRCNSIQFSAGFSVKGIGAEQVLQWNRTKRFGRVYLDDDKEPWIEMDMDVEHGATVAALANNFDRWDGVLTEFKKFISK